MYWWTDMFFIVCVCVCFPVYILRILLLRYYVIAGYWLIPNLVQSASGRLKRIRVACILHAHHHVNSSFAGMLFPFWVKSYVCMCVCVWVCGCVGVLYLTVIIYTCLCFHMHISWSLSSWTIKKLVAWQ